METYLFIIVLTWGIMQFLLRRQYKAQAEMYRKYIERGKYKYNNERIIISDISVFHPERQN